MLGLGSHRQAFEAAQSRTKPEGLPNHLSLVPTLGVTHSQAEGACTKQQQPQIMARD